MIDDDLSRGVINNRLNRIKRIPKWAVSEELAPPSVYEGLRSVSGLLRSHDRSRDSAGQAGVRRVDQLESRTGLKLTHDSSTNQLIRRYRKLKETSR